MFQRFPPSPKSKKGKHNSPPPPPNQKANRKTHPFPKPQDINVFLDHNLKKEIWKKKF